MTSDDPMTDPLVDALAARLDRLERFAAEGVVGWMQEAGLSLAEVRVLLVLAEEQSLGGGDLAERTGMTVDAAYTTMEQLEARGWLGQEHRRHHLTETGHETVRTLTATRHRAVEHFVKSLSPGDRAQIAAALGLD
jgi:DNA-binding MarR family transcriptional regulator